MIGTSILTVYQGHISKASLKSGADAGLTSLDCVISHTLRDELSCIRTSFLGSELIFLFFLVPRPNLQHL